MLSVVDVLVAIGQGVGVRVVEQSVVSITPGKFLGAETQVGIWHEFWVFMRVRLALHVSVEPADSNTR